MHFNTNLKGSLRDYYVNQRDSTTKTNRRNVDDGDLAHDFKSGRKKNVSD